MSSVVVWLCVELRMSWMQIQLCMNCDGRRMTERPRRRREPSRYAISTLTLLSMRTAKPAATRGQWTSPFGTTCAIYRLRTYRPPYWRHQPKKHRNAYRTCRTRFACCWPCLAMATTWRSRLRLGVSCHENTIEGQWTRCSPGDKVEMLVLKSFSDDTNLST